MNQTRSMVIHNYFCLLKNYKVSQELWPDLIVASCTNLLFARALSLSFFYGLYHTSFCWTIFLNFFPKLLVYYRLMYTYQIQPKHIQLDYTFQEVFLSTSFCNFRRVILNTTFLVDLLKLFLHMLWIFFLVKR